MYTVTFIAVAVFLVIAAAFSILALVQLGENDDRARGTLTTGYVFSLFGVIFGSMFFLLSH